MLLDLGFYGHGGGSHRYSVCIERLRLLELAFLFGWCVQAHSAMHPRAMGTATVDCFQSLRTNTTVMQMKVRGFEYGWRSVRSPGFEEAARTIEHRANLG